jgi:hypothetical protein
MFLNPKVTPDGADGTVAIDQIADEDIDHVLELATVVRPAIRFLTTARWQRTWRWRADVESDPVTCSALISGSLGALSDRRAPRRKAA